MCNKQARTLSPKKERCHIITLKNISLSFGNQRIFDGLTATFEQHDRIGLIGRNGQGKSTLLKVIMATQGIDSGSVTEMAGKRIAYLNQEIFLHSEKSAIDQVVESSQAIADSLYQGRAQVRAEADRILRGLGFSSERLTSCVNTLSGGWKMRLVLAQLLVQKADFYLFDEPTNHLDIVAKEWFLSFLHETDAGFLLVCHEKYFLNKLCTSIFALDTPQGCWYKGSYDDYLKLSAHAASMQAAAFIQQQKMIKQKKDTIARFGASANRARQAQSMKKELEKLTLIAPPREAAVLHVPLPPLQQSGKTVLTVDNLSTGYAGMPLFVGLSMVITRQEKIALIAANGVGKTTLLHALAGRIPLLQGKIDFGTQVTYALFHQEQSTFLHPEYTVWDEVTSDSEIRCTEASLRSLLGSFLFSHDALHKKISVLSGGEKSRVGIVKVLLKQANFLLLDEPTNHLDIPSKEVLLQSLRDYTGTILFVSHDQDFVNNLATGIIELTPTGAVRYAGNYESYLQQKAQQSATNKMQAGRALPADRLPDKLVRHTKELRSLEQAIDKLTQERTRLTAELENVAYGTSDFSRRYERLEKIAQEEAVLLDAWQASVEKNS